MKAKIFVVFVTALALGFSTFAFATPVLVSQRPWGQDYAVNNMNDVFGAGNYAVYNSYAAANPTEIFAPSNTFVMLEGGAGTDSIWYNYLTSNSSTIQQWVNSGGSLLLNSGGWNAGNHAFGPGTLVLSPYKSASFTGTLTGAGQAAFTFKPTPVTQSGNYLAHDYIIGTGLTTFMEGTGGKAIVAGTDYGDGYIMYSGLTGSWAHAAGNGLLDDVIEFTARQGSEPAPVPEPATVILVAAGLAAIPLLRRIRS